MFFMGKDLAIFFSQSHIHPFYHQFKASNKLRKHLFHERKKEKGQRYSLTYAMRLK